MNAEQAKEIQDKCLERMKKSGLTPIERMDCFAEFEKTNPSVELVKAFYDVWSPDDDKDMIVVGYKNPVDVTDELAKLVSDEEERKKLHILDVGAGTGEGGAKLIESGFLHVDATDGSPGMLDLAKKRGVYEHVLKAEVLVKGQRMHTVAPESSDVVVSSGSFYPFHLLGPHLTCFLDCAKTGGKIVVASACPRDDKAIGLRRAGQELVDSGIIEVIEERYVPKWYREDDGTVWALKKLKPLAQ